MILLHNTTTIYGVFSTLLNLRALTKNQLISYAGMIDVTIPALLP